MKSEFDNMGRTNIHTVLRSPLAPILLALLMAALFIGPLVGAAYHLRPNNENQDTANIYIFLYLGSPFIFGVILFSYCVYFFWPTGIITNKNLKIIDLIYYSVGGVALIWAFMEIAYGKNVEIIGRERLEIIKYMMVLLSMKVAKTIAEIAIAILGEHKIEEHKPL